MLSIKDVMRQVGAEKDAAPKPAPTKPLWSDLLKGMPDGGYVPCNGNKVPINPKTGYPRPKGDDWKDHPYTAAALDQAGPHVKAAGTLLGPPTGLLAVDLDSPGSDETLRLCTGLTLDDLPKTVVNSSGRPGRKKLFSGLRTRTGKD